MRITHTEMISVAVGVTLGALLWLANHLFGTWAVPSATSVWPSWFAGIQSLLEALVSVVPGVVAGWLAKARGLRVGLLVAVSFTLVSLGFVLAFWGAMSVSEIVHFIFFCMLLNLITQPISAVAGVALSHRRVAF